MKLSVDHMNNLMQQEARVGARPAIGWLSNQSLWTIYVTLLVVFDQLAMIAYQLAYWVRFHASLPIFQLEAAPSRPFYMTVILLLMPVWFIIFLVAGLYHRQNLMGGTGEYALVSRATSAGLLILIVAGFLEPEFIIARAWLLMAWSFSFVFVAFGRFLLRRWVYFLRRRGYFLSPTIIVGANDEGLSLAEQLRSWPTSGLHVVGFVDKKLRPGTKVLDGVPVLGKLEQLDQIIKEYGVGDLILATSAISSHDYLLEIFKAYGFSDELNVRMSSGLYEIITTGLQVKEFGFVPLVGVNKVRLTGTDRILKAVLELALILPGLILFIPLYLIIALAIKLDSPGPVLYRRRVMGVNGRQFDALKFRTMYVNGDEILAQHPELKEELARNHKLKRDPRVTRVGRFLRKFSLDELPQFINVLKREMALVGPRMICPEEVENYDQWGLNLLTVRPGITGLWQVSGRSDISYEDRVRLDMHYIRSWSIWLDLHLIWRTIPVILQGRGAY